MRFADKILNDLIVDPDVSLPVVTPVGETPDANCLPPILIGIGVAALVALAVVLIVTYTKRKNKAKDIMEDK